jgi:DNA mismatch endonuclease, patch repair protein
LKLGISQTPSLQYLQMSDVHSPAQRSYNMSRIRGKDTTPEKIVRSLLRAEGCRYRTNVGNLPGKPDIVLPRLRIAVFVHGCFWHRHKNCRFTTNPKSNAEFWAGKFARTVERDREHVRALKKSSWRVVTVWECAAKRSPDAVRNKLLRAIKASRSSRSNNACKTIKLKRLSRS